MTRIKYYRNCFLVFLLSIFSFGCFAQNVTEGNDNLAILANQMFVDVNNKDFDAILDMMHPKVYEIVPKNQMKKVIKSMFEGTDEFVIEIPKEIPRYKISEVFKGNENNLEYGFVSYDMKMKMTFNNQEFDADSKNMMKTMMQAKGMDVTFISNNSLDVLMKDRLTILLKEDDTNNEWVMVNYDPDSPLSYKVLSSDVLEAAKDYSRGLMLERKKSENK